MKKKLPIPKWILHVSFFLFLFSSAVQVLAQSADRVITGQVSDENNDPLPGVSISTQGGKSTASTDNNGKFSISVGPGITALVFTYVGFERRIVQINNRASINVNLKPSSSELNEVVVVGYGTQKKVNLTGSVATIDFSKLENTPQSNTLNILSGRVSGLSVVQPGGEPGADQPELFVRGIGTLNDSSPLVIIDGVQATLADVGNLTPQEIANISVLKDASSAAIYGARGANGVILVTTKNPGEGKLRINFNTYYGLQQATYLSKFVESWQWLYLDGEATTTTPEKDAVIKALQEGNYSDSAANTKWYEELFRTAPISNYNLSINGGNKNLAFQGSIGYQNQQGIMLGTDGSRYNFRTNIKARISEKLQAGLNLYGYQKLSSGPFQTSKSIMDRANKANPLTPIKYSNGDWGVYYPIGTGASQIVQNPVLFSEIGYTDNKDTKATIVTDLQYSPIKGLKARTAFNYTYGNGYTERFNPTYAYPWIDGTVALSNVNNNLIDANNSSDQLQLQTTLTYNKKFGKNHQFTALAGHEYTDFKSSRMQAQGQNLPSNSTPVLDRVVNTITVQGNAQAWRLQSFFGRANYVFKDRYLLEGNLRIDGSSRFPAESKYGYFPSFSAGWILSEEPFFKSMFEKNKIITLLKLRGGYGTVGNDRIGNYSYNQFLDLGRYYNFSGNIVSGGAITELSNPDIKWESTTTTDLGLDLEMFKSKLNVTLDVYNRYTNDILYRLPLAPSLGIIDPKKQPAIVNVGEVSNKGLDLAVAHNNHIGKVNYNLGFNYSYVKNKIEKLNTREAINSDQFVSILLREGQPINSYYGLIFDGLYRTAEDITKYPALSSSGLSLGTMRFKDINGDGKINEDDRVVMGNANTPTTVGINGGVAYSNFDLNFLFQGVKGKSIYLYDLNNRPGNTGISNYWKEWWDNRFDEVNNPNGTWPSLRRTAPDAKESSTFWLHDASYLRLKNVEIGYSVPKKFLNRVKIANARIFVSGQNLVTFSSLIKQLDPERSTNVTDNQSYPQTKVYSIGLNTTF